MFLAVPIVLIASHLIAFGEGPGLPKRALEQTMPTTVIQKVAKFAGPVLDWTERLSRPRLAAIADRERLVGILCLLLGIVLAAPIPFGNFAPALGIVVIAFGMLQRDGVIILIGVGLALALGVGLYFLADAVGEMVTG
jgi:hypothetical protein